MTKGLGNILKQAQQMHAKISQLQEEMAVKRWRPVPEEEW